MTIETGLKFICAGVRTRYHLCPKYGRGFRWAWLFFLALSAVKSHSLQMWALLTEFKGFEAIKPKVVLRLCYAPTTLMGKNALRFFHFLARNKINKEQFSCSGLKRKKKLNIEKESIWLFLARNVIKKVRLSFKLSRAFYWSHEITWSLQLTLITRALCSSSTELHVVSRSMGSSGKTPALKPKDRGFKPWRYLI